MLYTNLTSPISLPRFLSLIVSIRDKRDTKILFERVVFTIPMCFGGSESGRKNEKINLIRIHIAARSN